MLVCLPVCGHGRGHRAPCAGRAICASFAPLGVYIYAVGGESCTTRHPLLRSARLAAPTVTARVTPLSARSLSPLPHYMLNPFKPTQQPLTDATCSKVEIFDLRTVRPFHRSYTFSTNFASSARRRAASASSPCMTAYSSNALDPPTCRAEALA